MVEETRVSAGLSEAGAALGYSPSSGHPRAAPQPRGTPAPYPAFHHHSDSAPLGPGLSLCHPHSSLSHYPQFLFICGSYSPITFVDSRLQLRTFLLCVSASAPDADPHPFSMSQIQILQKKGSKLFRWSPGRLWVGLSHPEPPHNPLTGLYVVCS